MLIENLIEKNYCINNKGHVVPIEEKLVKKISSVFSADFIQEQAIKSRFIQRVSKITAVKFLDLLIYNSSQNQCLSLNQLSIEASSCHHVDISKQGLDQRMNCHAVEFMHRLLQKQLVNQISESLDVGVMEQFNRVRIKDSTKFDVDKQLQQWLPGFGGSASPASACIQYEFDMKSGSVMDLDLTPGNRPDSKDAQEKYPDIRQGDLIIRDLGYFSLEVLSEIQQAEAYFISRLNFKTIVYEQKEGVLVELDFGKLYRYMEQTGIAKMEKRVLIGKEEKMPVRLIIERMPDQIFEQRVRKAKAYNHKKGYLTSTGYTERARFNLFVTNAGEDMLSSQAVPLFYKVRWQVELIFKVWKSTFGIQATRKMKIERFLCLLYSKLLLIMVNWEIILVYRHGYYRVKGKLLSLDKCFKTLKSNGRKFRDILNKQGSAIEELVQWAGKIFESKHWLEKRKNKLCYEELISVIF